MKYIRHLFLLVVLFVANSIAATITIIGGAQYTLQNVGGNAVWRTAAGAVLTKQALQTHLDSPAIKPHCLKEIIRLIMAQESALANILAAAPIVGGHNIAGDINYVNANIAGIPAALQRLKEHLLEQGHLGFYPMVTGAAPGQKINKDTNRGIFNIIGTSASAVTNHFYGAAITPGPPPAPGAANPIAVANAGRFHVFPNIQNKDMAIFFPNGYTFDAQARLTVPTPPAGIAPVGGGNTGNWYVAFDAIVGAASPTFTQIADGILESTFSQGGLHEVTISDSVDRFHPELKFEIDCALNPVPFSNRGILENGSWIGMERDNHRYTNALRIPVEVNTGVIRIPTIFPIAGNLQDPLVQMAPPVAPGILHRAWNAVPTPVRYLGAMALGAIGWHYVYPLISKWLK